MHRRCTTAHENAAQSFAGQTDSQHGRLGHVPSLGKIPLSTGGTPVPRRRVFRRDTEDTEIH